jgi:hypothetical protein
VKINIHSSEKHSNDIPAIMNYTPSKQSSPTYEWTEEHAECQRSNIKHLMTFSHCYSCRKFGYFKERKLCPHQEKYHSRDFDIEKCIYGPTGKMPIKEVVHATSTNIPPSLQANNINEQQQQQLNNEATRPAPQPSFIVFDHSHRSLSMYPQEITSSSVWIRNDLPVCAPPPPDGDAKLRKQIRSRYVKATNEMIERYVRQERARLDLKWCLDEYFGWNENNPYLGQLVTVNIKGIVHLAYILELNSTNITVAPVDSLDLTEVVGRDDIYSAEDGPFYEKFVETRHVLHPQHVLDCLAKQKHELIQSNHAAPFDTSFIDSVQDNIEINWPDGPDTWVIHNELPQRTQFSQQKQQEGPSIFTFNVVECPTQEASSDFVDTVSSTYIESRPLVDVGPVFSTVLKPHEYFAEQNIERMAHNVGETRSLSSISYQYTFDDDQCTVMNVVLPPYKDAHGLQPLHLSSVDQRNFNIGKLKRRIHTPILQQATMSFIGGFLILLCIFSASFQRSINMNSTDSPISCAIVPPAFTVMMMVSHLIFTHKTNARQFILNSSWCDTNRDWFRALAVP